jgi:hypothetical protein
MRLPYRNVVSVLVIGAANSLILADPPPAQPPTCQRIRAACKDAGFVMGGTVGNRLVKDCFEPIVYGASRPDGVTRPLPDVAPQLAASCRSDVIATPSSPKAKPP